MFLHNTEQIVRKFLICALTEHIYVVPPARCCRVVCVASPNIGSRKKHPHRSARVSSPRSECAHPDSFFDDVSTLLVLLLLCTFDHALSIETYRIMNTVTRIEKQITRT